MNTDELTAVQAENRDRVSRGRRVSDKITARMVLASALINLTGAPARIAFTWGLAIYAIKVAGGFLLDIVRELKGTETLANIQIGLNAALSVNPETASGGWTLACELLFLWAVGATAIAGVAMLYVQRERMLRNQIIRDLGGQITYLETMHDKNRSSSGLTPSGDTHPKDI